MYVAPENLRNGTSYTKSWKQHHRIKFWKCLYPWKWTLGTMKLLPRSRSVDFMQISSFSQQNNQTSCIYTSSNNIKSEVKKNQRQIWNQWLAASMRSMEGVRSTLQKTESARNHEKNINRVLEMFVCIKMGAGCNETTAAIAFERFHANSNILSKKNC